MYEYYGYQGPYYRELLRGYIRKIYGVAECIGAHAILIMASLLKEINIASQFEGIPVLYGLRTGVKSVSLKLRIWPRRLLDSEGSKN